MMDIKRFILAVAVATAAGIVLINLSWLFLSVTSVGRIDWFYYPYIGKHLTFLIIKHAVFSALTALILSAVADRSVRNGIQIGVFCGLIFYLSGAISRLSEGHLFGQVFYYILLFGIIGGISGAIIMRVLVTHSSAASEPPLDQP